MKIQFILCLILLLSVTFINAQKENKAKAGAPIQKSDKEDEQIIKEELKKEELKKEEPKKEELKKEVPKKEEPKKEELKKEVPKKEEPKKEELKKEEPKKEELKKEEPKKEELKKEELKKEELKKEELKKEVHEAAAQPKYLACVTIQKVYYDTDYTNLANMLYPLAHLNRNQLLEKVLYENLENCINKITDEDEDFVIENSDDESKLQSKVSSYVLPQDVMSQKLGSLTLSTSQTNLKKIIQKDFEKEIKEVKNSQKQLEKRLDELVPEKSDGEKAEKRSKYSNERNAKIYKALLWSAVVIGLTIVFSVGKMFYDKSKSKARQEDAVINKKQKQEYAQKKKEEKEKQIQQIKAKKEQDKKVKKGEKLFKKNVVVQDNVQSVNYDDSDDDNAGLQEVFEALKKKKEQNKIISVGGPKKTVKAKETKPQAAQPQPKAQTQAQPKGQAQPQQANKKKGDKPAQETKAQAPAKVEEKKLVTEVVIPTPVAPTENWTVIKKTKLKKNSKKNKGDKDEDEHAPLKGDLESPSISPVKAKPVEEWTTITEKNKKKKN